MTGILCGLNPTGRSHCKYEVSRGCTHGGACPHKRDVDYYLTQARTEIERPLAPCGNYERIGRLERSLILTLNYLSSNQSITQENE